MSANAEVRNWLQTDEPLHIRPELTRYCWQLPSGGVVVVCSNRPREVVELAETLYRLSAVVSSAVVVEPTPVLRPRVPPASMRRARRLVAD